MSIETDVRSALSGLAGGRVYPIRLPQNPTYPAVTYFAAGGQRQRTFGSVAGRMARIQLDAWDKTYAGAKSLMDSVRSTLLASSLVMLFDGDEVDIYEPDTHLHRVTLDIFVYS